MRRVAARPSDKRTLSLAVRKNWILTALGTRFVSAIEYLSFERQAEEKHELHHGEVIAMSGASREHGLTLQRIT